MQYNIGLDAGTSNFQIRHWDGVTTFRDFTVDTNGNVGIGTDGPAASLHVRKDTGVSTEGTVLILDSANSGGGNGGSLDFTNVGAGYLGSIAVMDNGTADGRMEFRTSGDAGPTASRLTSTSTRMSILANGNVGIGTTAPTAKLHVAGAAGTDGIRFPDGTLQTTAAVGGSGLLQHSITRFVPSAVQSLTTSYADIDGSSKVVTPVSATSKIKYSYRFHVSFDGGTRPIGHFRVYRDGVEVTGCAKTFSTFDSQVELVCLIDSWGTTASTLKIAGREWSAGYPARVHQSYDWDGGVGGPLVHAYVEIEEFP